MAARTAGDSAEVITVANPSRATGWDDTAPAIRACSSTCDDTGYFTAVTLADGTALPGWITWTDSTATHNKINVKPVDGAVMS